MFDGFRSRWMIPCWCRCSTARATVATSRTAAGGSIGPCGDPLGQALAVDVLHRKEVLAVELADVVDVDDVRVAEPGGGLRLGLEAADQLGRGQVAGQDHLHGHGAVEALLPGLVDHAHPAPADLADQLVRAEIPRQFAGGRRAVGSRSPAGVAIVPPAGPAFQRLQAIQRRGQFGMFPQERSPIRPLARLELGEIGVEDVQRFFVDRSVAHRCRR